MSHAQQLHHRRYLNDYPEIINRQGLPGQLQNDLCLQVQATVSATVQHLIEATLEEERTAYLGLDRYAHLGWGRPPEATRSRSYRREWLTQYGRIADSHVPKLRRGNGALSWQSMTRYEHRWRPLLDQQVLSYCLGHCLRDWQETMAWSRSEVLQLLACNCMVARVAPDLERGASEADIRQRAETFRETWDDREPNAVANFGVDVDQTLVSCSIAVPESLLRLIRPTTLLERFHEEMRRKQRDIGMFQSEQGCEVLWYLVSRRETTKQQARLQSRW